MKTRDTIDFITLKTDNDNDGEWVGELVLGNNEYPIIKTERHGFFCAAVGAYQVSKEYLQQKLNDAVGSDKTGNDYYSFFCGNIGLCEDKPKYMPQNNSNQLKTVCFV